MLFLKLDVAKAESNFAEGIVLPSSWKASTVGVFRRGTF